MRIQRLPLHLFNGVAEAIGFGVGHPIWQITFEKLLDCLIEDKQLEQARKLFNNSIADIQREENIDSEPIIDKLIAILEKVLLKHQATDSWNGD